LGFSPSGATGPEGRGQVGIENAALEGLVFHSNRWLILENQLAALAAETTK